MPSPDVNSSKLVAPYIATRFGSSRTRKQEVAGIGEHLQEPEDPERVAEAGERRDEAADEGADDRRRHRHARQHDAAVIGAVAHVDQKRPRERLRQLVGELVEHDERQDLERALAGEEPEQRQPDRVAQRCAAAAAGTSGSGDFHVSTSIGT